VRLSYDRNRYYDRREGRFTQEDPAGIAGGVNLFPAQREREKKHKH
jgi:RHS repeat-associated protein